MGDASGPLADTLTYDSGTKTLRLRRHGRETVHRESIFDYLDRTTQADLLFDQAVPFDFHGGWVGYFGYELKQECGSEAPFPSPHADAMWVFADRFLVFDHQARETWLVVVGDDDDEAWFAATQARLDSMHALPPLPTTPSGRPANGQLRQHKAEYVEAIRTALDEIEAGESYEICLTNMISCPVRSDGFSLYRVLRRINPAPFAAYLRFDVLEVLSASPERFLHVDGQGNVAARPIKGTAPRGAGPAQDKVNALKLQTDEKSRAENLMIVDLLRNDLGAVCEIGSVTVPELMTIETYATLHQMVSTVSGRLKSDCSAVKCAQRAFPGGSMTGAPKLRTMQILDRLEQAPRGIYSGALGYFGLNGTADLSIVIRTIVLENGHASIGVGGAILALSDPEAEFDEILLKARAQLSAIQIANGLEAPADIERVSEDTSP
jgi:para-aminobenzoate synthetase